MIGNLSWMYHVLAVSKLDSPLDHLLHYPLPDGAVPGFEDLTITISNYSGPARDYVRTMIESLGATFEGAMSKKTSFVVTARCVPSPLYPPAPLLQRLTLSSLLSEFGAKVKHAQQWNIPVVTHVWLENCISEWTLIPAGASRSFLPSVNPATNFMTLLGHTELKREAVKKWAALPRSIEARDDALKPWEDEVEPEREEDEPVEMEVDGAVEAFGDVEAMEVEEPERVQQIEFDDDDDDEPEVVVPKAKGKGKAKEVAPPKSKATATKKDKPKPKSKDPSVLRSNGGPSPRDPVPGPSKKKKAAPTPAPETSEPDTESDEEHDVPPKASTSAATPIVAPTAASRRTAVSSVLTSAESSSSSEEEFTPKNIFTGNNLVVGKRGAASQAAKKLETQMQDANRFAIEQRASSGKKRRRESHPHVKEEGDDDDEDGEEDEDEREDVKRKVVKKERERVVPPSSMEKPVLKRKKAPATKKVLAKSVIGRSGVADADTQEGAISSFDNPPHAAPPK